MVDGNIKSNIIPIIGGVIGGVVFLIFQFTTHNYSISLDESCQDFNYDYYDKNLRSCVSHSGRMVKVSIGDCSIDGACRVVPSKTGEIYEGMYHTNKVVEIG